jgi:hypothetical protein
MKKRYKLIAALLFCSTGFAQTNVPFTTSGTFVVPAGVTNVAIQVVGAGGDGGGNGGGGGGGGGYAVGAYTVVPGSTLNITVGTHGIDATAGTTSVDALISASGGENGGSGGTFSPGGAPGVGMGGAVNRTGGAGGNGTWTYFGGGGGGAAGSTSNGSIGGSTPAYDPIAGNCLQPGGAPGMSGGAPGGNGGKGSGFSDNFCSANNPATPGLTYGGGGGGANGAGGPASEGANGYCIISYTGGCTVDVTTSLSGVTITANATSVTYQWLNCATNLPIAGATNASYTATTNGDYAVVINNGTCSDTSACVNINCSPNTTTSLSGVTITSNATGVSYQWINCATNLPISGATNASYTATANGDYAVVVDNGTCSDTSACVNINCSVDIATTLIDFTISADATGLEYQWINCATNLPIAGETNFSYSATANGDYAVIIEDDGCIDTSACVNISGLGINNTGEMKLGVYPNPFGNKINIENETGTEYFELINAQGQLVWSGKNIESAEFSTLPEGVYVLKIKRDELIQMVSVIKK